VICYGITSLLVSHLITKVKSGALTIVQAEAITVLVGRMKYYSVVQIFLITGACWNGYNLATTNSVASNYAYFLTAPACGIGYFLVFLYMQPLALKICGKLLTTIPIIGYLFQTREKEETIDDFLESGSPGRDSNSALRPSGINDLTDEELSRAIDIRYSATPRGVELSEAISASRINSMRIPDDRASCSSEYSENNDLRTSESRNFSTIFTGFILQRPQSIKQINEALERNRENTRINSMRVNAEPVNSTVNIIHNTVNNVETVQNVSSETR
jgi:hypothetical protein